MTNRTDGLTRHLGIGWNASSLYLMVLLLLMNASVRLLGFAATLRLIGRIARQASLRRSVDAAAVRDMARMVAEVAALLPVRARCLEQSLALFFELRRRGAAVTFKIGVQPYGFVSHCWVEHNGEPINENGELLRKLAVFPEVPA